MENYLVEAWDKNCVKPNFQCIVKVEDFKRIESLFENLCAKKGYSYRASLCDSIYYVMNDILNTKDA